MLILTRRIGESIRIGENVAVTVLEVKSTQVRLGVMAPKSVVVDREEHWRGLEPRWFRKVSAPRL